jgi:hypothetical protein
LDGVGFRAPVGEKWSEPMFVQYRTQAVKEFDVPRVGQVVDDYADGSSPPLGETARCRVRAITELGDSLQHRPPLYVTDSW